MFESWVYTQQFYSECIQHKWINATAKINGNYSFELNDSWKFLSWQFELFSHVTEVVDYAIFDAFMDNNMYLNAHQSFIVKIQIKLNQSVTLPQWTSCIPIFHFHFHFQWPRRFMLEYWFFTETLMVMLLKPWYAWLIIGFMMPQFIACSFIK